MKIILNFVFIVSLFFSLGCKLEDGWLGIKVFETNREEVEKLLGKPTEEDMGLVRYETDGELFQFYFASEPCSNPNILAGSFNVRKGTVLQYAVTPKNELQIDRLEWNKTSYERTESRHQLGIVSYRNRRDAIDVETTKFKDGRGEIFRTIDFYRPETKNAEYSCKK